jgi:hypothetical protein
MVDARQIAKIGLELMVEFSEYVVDHPEVDDLLPWRCYLHFQIEGNVEFNRYSREMAKQQRREEGVPVVWVWVKGLAPRQGSRLIDPVIEPPSPVA